MRFLALALPLLLGTVAPAQAQVGIPIGLGISVPGVNIGINMPVYPRLVLVPGYPVYYDPQASDNYFFYDGLYWVYQGDAWYQSAWYNGPWQATDPQYVPSYVLRIPIRYYRRAPVYFRTWALNQAPHWGEHWGRDWEQRRPDWNRGDNQARPPAAPLPNYQRADGGEHYPRDVEQQQRIGTDHYRYPPRERQVRQDLEQRGRPAADAQDGPRGNHRDRDHDRGNGRDRDHNRDGQP